MLKVIFNLVVGMFHLHPATVEGRTFANNVAAIASIVAGAATAYATGQTDPLIYIAAVAGLFTCAGNISHRDALSKIGATLENLTATQGQTQK